MTIWTDQEADFGVWWIQVYALDQINGIRSESETLELTIKDPCDLEVLKITPFPEPSVTYLLG